MKTSLELLFISMKKIMLFSMVFCSFLTLGQENDEIDQVALIQEMQILHKKENQMSFTFWVPQSYWRIALKDNPEISEETIELIESIFENHTVICAADILISPKTLFTYKDDSTLRSEIRIIDYNGREHFPLSSESLSPEMSAILVNMTPMFREMFGQLGEGMHFYIFENFDSENQALINEKENGGFMVKHSNFEFKWTLPLVSLMPEKYCPTDNEKMKGNWKYCPIHGVKLD